MRTRPSVRLRPMVFCIASVLGAQATPQASQVIQTETREVLVDAIVTTKSGAYVPDLTAKDFRIWQDGKEQTIKGFSAEGTSASTQTRSLVLFFDETSMEQRDQIAVRQAAASFIDAEAGPNHRMAVVTFNGTMRIAQSFTDNPGRLKDALSQASFRGLAPSAADSDRSHDPSRTEEDRMVGRANANAIATSMGARNMIRSLGSLGRSLGALPGRKIVVLFSGTLPAPADPKGEVRDAIEAANKSGVAFYAVDVRPVFTQTDPGDTPALPADRHPRGPLGAQAQGDSDNFGSPIPESGAGSQSMLFNLANGTGGFVVRNTNDLLGGLQSIGKEQDQYYVLTYTPPDSKEGTCHSLRVKVDRKQTNLRSRSSYCTEKPVDLLAGTTAAAELEKRAAASQQGDITASMQLPYFYIAPNVARVQLAMEISPEALKFENKKGKLHAELNFLGVATNAEGDVRARFSDVLRFDFDSAAQAETVKGKPLQYEKEFKIAPGQYNFTVAFGVGDTSFGKVQAPLVIEPWTGGFAISGLVLSRETRPASDLGLAPAADEHTPLVSQGIQVLPAGSSVFAKSEPAFVYFELYGPDAAMARVRLRVLDGKSGEQKWDGGLMNLPPQGRAGKMPVAAGAKLPVESLPAGVYRLEVIAFDPNGKQIKRATDFELK